MAYGLIAALAIGAAATLATDAIEHRVQVDHHRGAIDARYTGSVTVAHRQVGSVAPGGRPSTLRCAWRANLSVARDARHPAGSLSRTIRREGVASGSRPGWCGTQTRAIAQEVARRGGEMRAHLIAVSEADRATLIAEADTAHGARAG